MLVFTRKHGESFKIGDDVTVTILGIHGQQVRVEIEAPKTIPVHRLEIYNRIEIEKITNGNQ